MKKGSFSTILLVIILIFGLSLLLYPSFSDYWNSLHQTRVMDTYTENVSRLDDNVYDEIWEKAREYNKKLLQQDNIFELSNSMLQEYNENLNVAGNGVMGSIEIPKINCKLPIYHTVEDTVLQIAIGHIEWSSLPTGGTDTHCVLSGHRGLPSAKLFSDLNQMQEGDTFNLHIMDESLTYEVTKIQIVLPHEIENLLIEEGKDLCTLVTCTPYGINSHRLLVRAERTDDIVVGKTVRVTADASKIEPIIVAPVVAAPMLLVLLILLLLPKRKKYRRIDQ
ncbi:MAG: class C sortase [Ruminococcaceae bacterium]|nr:class C sortase [Oscillospiraceae bacterium]